MANVKISQLPSWTGSSADLRWFVMNNSGETETFKFSGYSTSITYGTGTNSIKSVNATLSSGNGSIAIGNTASADGDDAVVIGNNNSTPAGYRSVVIGRHPYAPGTTHVVVGSGAYVYGNNSIVIGHETSANSNGIVLGSNTSRASANWAITLGHQNERNQSEYTNILGTNNRVGQAPNYLGSPYSTVIGSNNILETDNGYYYNAILNSYGNTIVGAIRGATLINANNLTNVESGDIIINTVPNTFTGTGKYKQLFSGSGNTMSDVGDFRTLLNGQNNELNKSNYSTVINGKNNSLVSNDYSAIIGGTGNTMASSISAENGKGNYIINSRDCKVEKDGQYQSNNVNYIGCDNVRLENLNDVTLINVKNITAENGGVATGTTVFRNTLTLGATTFQADTYTSTGATTNIVIDPRQQDYIEINTDGSTTYNISFTFVDSAIYSNIHLYISYVAGSTINFVNGANTQWRFTNNTAPVFSGTNRNIIVMSTWANDDVWEVSRSMYMS